MKLLLFFCLLTCFVSCDYFGHLPIDSALSTYANEAIKDFLTTLQRHMDCHIDESPLITQTLNHHAFNYIGNFALPHSKTYKKNKEGDSYTYNQPMYKTYIRSHDKTEMYNKLKSVGRYLESIKKLLIEYNNVVVGFENKLKGNNSVVIGSNNTIGGNNFWVFDSNVKEVGIEDGVLII